jgi:hypothetical protein
MSARPMMADDTRRAHGEAMITPEELLAGSELTYDVEIPAAVLRPSIGDGAAATAAVDGASSRVRLRPLTVRDVQLIAKAAKSDEVLTSILMIQRAVVEPELKEREVAQMSGGLVRFLVERINRISGLTAADDDMRAIADSPLVQAFVALAKEFGWTPEQIKGLTMGQILGYLEVLNQSHRAR